MDCFTYYTQISVKSKKDTYNANPIYSRNKDYKITRFVVCALAPKTSALQKFKEESYKFSKTCSKIEERNAVTEEIPHHSIYYASGHV